jgi:hypothetical protein
MKNEEYLSFVICLFSFFTRFFVLFVVKVLLYCLYSLFLVIKSNADAYKQSGHIDFSSLW